MSLFQSAEALRYRNSTLPETSFQNPMQWLLDWVGGGKTVSGVDVDPENAISLTTVFNAITLISEGLARLPFGPQITETVTNKDGTDRKSIRVLKEHKSYILTARRPHPYISSFMFRQVMLNWACRYDNAYAVIERDGFANPISLFPFHPKRVVPKITEDQRLVFEIDGMEIIDHMNMFHIIGYTNNGITGLSRINIAREALGKAMATQKFGAEFFGKGINVSGFIKTKKHLKDKDAVERVKTSFAKKYGGQNGQFSVGLLEDDADWLSNETDPGKAQLNETTKADGVMVAQLLNIPVTMLKFLERGTAYANVEQLYIQFVNNTLIPWGEKWEAECWYKLLTEKEKRQDNIEFKYNYNALLKGDTENRAKFYEAMSNVGAYSPNRILELEDENGYEDGDVHLVAPGSTTIENIDNETQNTITQD